MPDVSIAILAGGQSRRMGQNKSFVSLHGKPMMTHVLESLAPLELPTFIVTNTPDDYAHYGLPMVGDVIPQHGALGGLYTALKFSRTPYVLCAACDMPFLSLPLLRFLIDQCPGHDAAAATLEGVWQVFPGVYSQACLSTLERSIAAGALQLQRVLNSLNIAALQDAQLRPFDPDLRSFANINTPIELTRFENSTDDKNTHPEGS
jgi:molybdenum cofactor guanylyltransferase